MLAEAHHQLGRFAHRGQVGADIDGVGDEQQRHQRVTSQRGITSPMLPARPWPVTRPIARRPLDRHHQREGEQQGPEQVEAELRARPGLGGDAAGIVVGRAGDQARAQLVAHGDAGQPPNQALFVCRSGHWSKGRQKAKGISGAGSGAGAYHGTHLQPGGLHENHRVRVFRLHYPTCRQGADRFGGSSQARAGLPAPGHGVLGYKVVDDKTLIVTDKAQKAYQSFTQAGLPRSQMAFGAGLQKL